MFENLRSIQISMTNDIPLQALTVRPLSRNEAEKINDAFSVDGVLRGKFMVRAHSRVSQANVNVSLPVEGEIPERGFIRWLWLLQRYFVRGYIHFMALSDSLLQWLGYS